MAETDHWALPSPPLRRGRPAGSTRWTRHGATIAVAVGLAVVAGYRIVILGIRHEPNGVDFGNWLMLGHALVGSDLPEAAHVVYPPVVPLLAVAFTKVFGVVWGSALVLGASGVAPGVGLYVAARWNGIRWAAVAPAVLIAATSSTGEAVAWGGAPQLIGMGCAAVVLGGAVRLLDERRLATAGWVALAVFGVAATSHLVFAQTVLTLVVLAALVLLVGDRGLFGRHTWGGRNGWFACAAVVIAPLVVLIPLYLDLFATVGQSFAQSDSTAAGWSSFHGFVEHLSVVDRDAPWFWRPVLVICGIIPLALIPTRWRRHRLWAPTVALVIVIVIQAVASGQDRLVYLAPLAVGFALTFLGDILEGSTPHTLVAARLRNAVLGVGLVAMLVASVTGLAYFPRERDFYGRFTPPGTVVGLDWIRGHTPPGSLMMVAPVNGAPFGWWVQGSARRAAYVGSEGRWLNFPEERDRAEATIEVLSTQDVFGQDVQRRLAQLDIDYLVLPWAWGGVDRNQVKQFELAHPEAVPYNGKGLVVIDVAALGDATAQ